MKKLILAIAAVAAASSAYAAAPGAASSKFYDQIRAHVQAVRNDTNIEAGNKSEVAIAKAFSVSLDDATLFLSKQANGDIWRIHTNGKYNGKVTKEGDIAVYTKFFDAVKGEAKEADLNEPNADGEVFNWNVTAVDEHSIVVCRHD
jgi:opacity protein-like surface antigen